MKARLKKLVLLLLATSGCLVAAEYSYRTYLRRAHTRVMDGFVTQSVPWELRTGSDCVYGLRRGWTHRGEGWGFTVNTQGFRGRLMEDTGPGVKRVLALGDSFTFGWGVGQGKAYPHLLEARLAAAGHESVVFNAGVPGYNTRQQACLLKQILDQAAPQVVLLGYVVNDAEPQHTVPTSPDLEHRYVRSWLLDRARELINLEPRIHRHSLDYLRGFAEQSPKWRASKAALARMARLCRERKVSLVVVILPDLDEHFDASYRPAPIHAAVKSWGKELGLPVYDLLDRWRGKDHKQYKLAEGHPNEKGHQAIAAFVAEVMNKELGTPPRPTQ